MILYPLCHAIGVWSLVACSWESARERAHRLCAECGLSADETDELIDGVRHSTLTRDENLQLFYAMFEHRADAKLCEACPVVILDAGEE